MQQKQIIRATPYSEPKRKDYSFFPKIQKTDHSSNVKSIFKSMAKQYNQKAIIKIKNKKAQNEELEQKRVRGLPDNPQIPTKKGTIMQLDQQKIRQSKEFCQLQKQIEQLSKQFEKEMQEIQNKKKQIQQKCLSVKKINFKQKYQFWELKNEIITLQAALQEEEEQNYRIANYSYFPSNFYDHDSQDQDQDEGQGVRSSLGEQSQIRDSFYNDNDSN